MKAIKNAKIIFPDRIEEGLTLFFSDRIEKIVKDQEIGEGTQIIDAKGAYLAPGLIDIHIHGYMGRDFCEGKDDALREIAKGIVKNGVTGFLPTTMTESLETIERAIGVARNLKEESKNWQGAEILGVHAEGPFISALKKGAQDASYILKPDSKFVQKHQDVIKIITLAPEEDNEDMSEIEKMAKSGVVVSMGHTSANAKTALKAVEKGVRHATHLFNAMTPLSHREPGVVGASLSSDVSVELIVDTHHVSPLLFDMIYKQKGRKLVFITDCLSAGGLDEGEYMLGGQKVIYKDDLCRLEDGTIAGSVLKLNKGVLNVFENSHIPLWECVNSATLNPATVIGISDKKGSIEVGKDADLILLDEKLSVLKTIIGGKVKYES